MERRRKIQVRGSILSTIAIATAMPLQAAEQPVLFSSAFITGSHTYEATDFAAIIGPHVGRPVSSELMQQLAADIERLYRSDGYVSPTVLQADSEFGSSTPRLHVYEAQIAEVVLRGNCGPYCDVIRADASALESSVIHKQRSRAHLRAIEQLPGVELSAVFEPRASEPNRYNLILTVSYQAVQVAAYLHNRGAEDSGRTVLGARTTFNGLLGIQEALTVRAAASSNIDDYHFVGGQLDRRFANVAASLDASASRIGTDWHYSNDRARLEFRTAAFDDGVLRVEPLIAFGASDSEGREVEEDYFASVRTRTLEAGIATRKASVGSATEVWSAVERSLGAFGAAVRTSDAAPYDVVFTKAVLDASHVHVLGPRWRLRAELEGQFSNDSLPPGERFTFGGARFGRAFDPASLIGDSGAAGSLQVEYLRQWQSALLDSGRVYVQADYGFSRLNLSHQSMNAASMSVGFSARVASLLASLELSCPLNGSEFEANDHQPRMFVYLQMSF
jgi:hemolysin activation/secretion protein